MSNLTVDIGRNGFSGYISDLLRFRHLCWNLVGADLRARFRRSRLGIIWAILQPLSFSLLISMVWGTLFQQNLLEFAVYVFSGMIVWEYFVNTVFQAQDTFVSSEGYLKQGRIPLIIFQARAPLSGCIIWLAGLVGLIGLLAALGKMPPLGLHVLNVVLFIPVIVLFLIPVAIIFSFLGTKLRDLRHAVTIFINALFFLSPVMLAREYLEKDEVAFLQYANPIIPLLDLFRAPLLEGTHWKLLDVQIMSVWIVVLWAIAIYMSKRFGRSIVFSI